jgi:hypothetical protein
MPAAALITMGKKHEHAHRDLGSEPTPNHDQDRKKMILGVGPR